MYHHSATCFILSNNDFESHHVDIYSSGSFHLSGCPPSWDHTPFFMCPLPSWPPCYQQGYGGCLHTARGTQAGGSLAENSEGMGFRRLQFVIDQGGVG